MEISVREPLGWSSAFRRFQKMSATTETGSLHFLLGDHAGHPYRPTRLWIVPDPSTAGGWGVALDRPTVDQGAVLIEDLKFWMLFDDSPKRFFDLGRGVEQKTVGCDREEVFRRYLRKVIANLPEERRQGPFWMLMPSIRDATRRRRYLDALEMVVPKAGVLPEPEMVVEYFRLIRRDLVLERGKTAIYLVIDIGASTCNCTFVLTRKDAKVVDTAAGRQRPGHLRAIQGDASRFAGHWVDQALLRLLGISTAGLDRSVLADLMAAVESAKIVASRQGEATLSHVAAESSRSVTREHLEAVSQELWSKLTPLYREVAGRFLAQVDSSPFAQSQFSGLLEEHSVSDVDDVQTMIDAVLLAGGTSLLPGFEEAMREHLFPAAPALKLHRIGEDFAVAAAVGAMAHVLHQQYSPSLLELTDRDDDLADAQFSGSLAKDIYLEWKIKKAQKAQMTRVLRRDDPLVDEGGSKDIDGLPPFRVGDVLRARLLPGPEAEQRSRIGIHPQELKVKQAPGRMALLWDTDKQEAKVSSQEVTGTGALFLGGTSLLSLQDKAERPSHLRSGTSWCQPAPDVVMDVGMSKTVAVVSSGGALDVQRLLTQTVEPNVSPERVLRAGSASDPLEEPVVSLESGTRSPAPASPPEPGDPAAAGVALPAAAKSVFAARLESALMSIEMLRSVEARADMTLLMLVLALGRFAMVAGPPGSGKSTMVRLAARLLGMRSSESNYFEVPVQPHWRLASDVPAALQGAAMGDAPPPYFVLFDEFNLSRPENYLMPLFAKLEEIGSGTRRPAIFACGTLNIDETSRPPSPKVLDRCFLIELEAPTTWSESIGASVRISASLPTIAPLPGSASEQGATNGPPPEIQEVLAVIWNCIATQNLRQDLLPSHRVLSDIQALLRLHEAESIPDRLLPRAALLDRLIAGRILTKISGAAEQVEPLVTSLHNHLAGKPFPRSIRRIGLAVAQLKMGFAAPFQ